MGRRRKAREVVLQALYELEFSERNWEEIVCDITQRRSSSPETIEYARRVLKNTLEHREQLDRKITEALEHWDLERLSLVDKNILRFALAELYFCPDVPGKVIVDEAIEIADKYSSKDAGRLINGVLDRYMKETRGKGERGGTGV